MTPEQKQLIREKWEKFIEKPKCKHGFTQGHYTCEPHDFPHVLGNRFGPDCETCNPPKEPTLNEIADFWLNEIDLAIKQTEERIVEIIQEMPNATRDEVEYEKVICVEDFITIIRNSQNLTKE